MIQSQLKLIVIMLLVIASQGAIVQAKDYSEKQLGTLFTTPPQRQALNAGRVGSKSEAGEAFFAGPDKVQINGIVSRSDGKSVVWVNGQNTMKNSMVDGVKVYSNSMTSSQKIPVMIDGKKVYIKPGESWAGNTDANKDNF